jgi:hypothetical protein
MQIARFTKNPDNNRFLEQKISLTKLSQMKKTQNNYQFNHRMGGH